MPNKPLFDSNKSLAVVGDAVLRLVVTTECYDRGMTRGFANIRLNDITKNEAPCELTYAHQIAQFIALQPGTVRPSDYMRATAVEAIIGAVFKDSGSDYGASKRAVEAFGILDQ
ncbi:hypothetical protein LTR85_007512 [Meristemomyces frigidus]|nr:hypothetical protein LTR85_007512 [Meristemomyces frigidus]